MIILGMEVEDRTGYLGIVACSPRGGKWLIMKDDGRMIRRSEHEIREYDHERALEITGQGDFTPSSLEED